MEKYPQKIGTGAHKRAFKVEEKNVFLHIELHKEAVKDTDQLTGEQVGIASQRHIITTGKSRR